MTADRVTCLTRQPRNRHTGHHRQRKPHHPDTACSNRHIDPLHTASADTSRTHATILLTAREPVHVVSQRLGHASPVVTMTVYAHVLPGSQREAADLFARLVGEAKGA